MRPTAVRATKQVPEPAPVVAKASHALRIAELEGLLFRLTERVDQLDQIAGQIAVETGVELP